MGGTALHAGIVVIQPGYSIILKSLATNGMSFTDMTLLKKKKKKKKKTHTPFITYAADTPPSLLQPRL